LIRSFNSYRYRLRDSVGYSGLIEYAANKPSEL
jgi:hypothetical protein